MSSRKSPTNSTPSKSKNKRKRSILTTKTSYKSSANQTNNYQVGEGEDNSQEEPPRKKFKRNNTRKRTRKELEDEEKEQLKKKQLTSLKIPKKNAKTLKEIASSHNNRVKRLQKDLSEPYNGVSKEKLSNMWIRTFCTTYIISTSFPKNFLDFARNKYKAILQEFDEDDFYYHYYICQYETVFLNIVPDYPRLEWFLFPPKREYFDIERIKYLFESMNSLNVPNRRSLSFMVIYENLLFYNRFEFFDEHLRSPSNICVLRRFFTIFLCVSIIYLMVIRCSLATLTYSSLKLCSIKVLYKSLVRFAPRISRKHCFIDISNLNLRTLSIEFLRNLILLTKESISPPENLEELQKSYENIDKTDCDLQQINNEDNSDEIVFDQEELNEITFSLNKDLLVYMDSLEEDQKLVTLMESIIWQEP